MKIVVLGAQGLLGQELVNVAKRRGHDVIAWTRAMGDVTDPSAMYGLCEHHPDMVINAIAFNAVDAAESEEGWRSAEELNATFPGLLAATLPACGTRLMHISTDYVFGGTQDTLFSEDDTPSPVNAYGKSKLLGEEAVRIANPDALIVRTSRLFGPPSTSPSAKKTFIQAILAKAEAEGKLSLVTNETSGPTYTRDLAEAMMQLVEDNAPGGTYHLCNEGQASWYEFGVEVLRLLGKTYPVEAITNEGFVRPAKRATFSTLANTKRPKLPHWKDALARFLAQA